MRVTVLMVDNGFGIENSDGMATLQSTATAVRVHFSPAEKVAGLVRDVEVPRDAVTAVEVVPEPLTALHGLRAPGFALPGVRKIGTWRGRGTRTLVSVRRDQPAVRVELTGQRWTGLLIGADDAARLAAELTPTA
jgi:hypothetical protein